MTQTNTRRLVQALVACAMIAATTIAGATPALAQTGGSPSLVGWLRVAHFSPDTRPVDVRITEVGRDKPIAELDSVPYGAVSPYWSLVPAKYLVTMTRAGSRASSTPISRLSVTVKQGESTTVAAYGRNSHLRMKAFADDLATPAAGSARIRMIQASTEAPTVTAATAAGKAIAIKAPGGTATEYVEVPAGTWTLVFRARKRDFSTTVTLESGSVNSLVVVDTSGGRLTARPVVDSAAALQIPVGAVQTGGGFLARESAVSDAIPSRAPLTRGGGSPEVAR
ncbi:DUF4397 domain-containing protein [Lacisediminihabitans sp. FW035]